MQHIALLRVESVGPERGEIAERKLPYETLVCVSLRPVHGRAGVLLLT